LILVSVLPVLTVSPIRNCHFQMLGAAVNATVYSMPLWIMRKSRRYFADAKSNHKRQVVSVQYCSLIEMQRAAAALLGREQGSG
jgi:hypothetical protein